MTVPMPPRNDTLDWLLQVAYTTGRLFVRNRLQNHAAATAFYFMLSATPLLLLLSYGTQWLAGLAETSNLATILLAALYQQLHLEALTDLGFIPNQAQLAAGGVGLLTLVLSSRGLVHAVHGAFHVIFPEDQHRPNLVRAWVIPLIIIPIAFLLVGVAAAIQAVLGFLAQYDFLGDHTATLLRALNLILAFAILWGLILNTYWGLPKPHPAWRQAALLAFLAAFTLFLLVWGFELFFKVEKYRSVYGGLGGVVFILIGAYLAGSVFYLWAQCLYTLDKVDVEALEKLFLAQDPNHEGPGALERYVFGRADRLLNKYGRSVTAGTVLIREGDTSKEAFFLYSGLAGLYKTIQGQDQKLGTLGEGQLFGEMAYLLGEARTATVTAETDLVVLVFPPELLEELMAYSAPLSRRIIGTLAQRLVRMNQAAAGG